MIDWHEIIAHLIELAVGASGSWVIARVRKAKRDLDAAFQKIRELERLVKQGGYCERCDSEDAERREESA